MIATAHNRSFAPICRSSMGAMATFRKESPTMPRKRKLPDGMVTRPERRGYYADFRVGGRRIQRKLGTDFEAAKSILHELRARAEKAEFSLLDNNYTLASLKSTYLRHCSQALKPRTVDTYLGQLGNILGALP